MGSKPSANSKIASMWALQIASLLVVATGVTTKAATTTTTTKITVSTDLKFTMGGAVTGKDIMGADKAKYELMMQTAVAAAAGNSLKAAHIAFVDTKTTTMVKATTVKGAKATTVKGAVTTKAKATTVTTKATTVTTKATTVTTTSTSTSTSTTTTVAAGRRLAYTVKTTAQITVTAATQAAVKASVDAPAFTTALATQIPIAAKVQGLDVKIGAITAVTATKGVIVGGASTTAAGASGANRAMALSGAALLIFAASQ